ncbi:MAG: hypothetical protein ACRCXT_19745 [Paraclostridium sp.]
MGKVLNKEDLKDTLKQCSCCKEVLHASTNEKESKFGAFWNGIGWYYQSYCKACAKEKSKYYTHKAKTQYILEQIRLKRDRERAARDWTVYKITLDISKFDSRVRRKWGRIHRSYFYIGITKQIVENRWNEHLYHLKKGSHSNYFLNWLYENIRELYREMSEDEFFNYFKSDIISFEVIEKLDKSYTETRAKINECFAVKRLEHEIKVRNKEKYIKTLSGKHTKKELCFTTDEMIVNVEYLKSNKVLLDEIKENKKNTLEPTKVKSII